MKGYFMFSILGNVAQTLGAGGFGPIDDDVDDGLSTMIYQPCITGSPCPGAEPERRGALAPKWWMRTMTTQPTSVPPILLLFLKPSKYGKHSL